jgi:hypothetical protein
MHTVSWETSLGNHGTVKRVSFTKEEDGATRRFGHTVYEAVGKEPALKMSRQLNCTSTGHLREQGIGGGGGRKSGGGSKSWSGGRQ